MRASMSVTRRGLWSELLTLAMSLLPMVEKSQLYQSALIMREVLVGSRRFSRLPDVDRRRLLLKSANARPPQAPFLSGLLKATAVAGVILMMFTTSSNGSRFFDECKKLRLSPRIPSLSEFQNLHEPSEGACCADKDGTSAY